MYGLIDWDLANSTSGRVFVLGENERYAIENYLLDPLAVAAAVLSEEPNSSTFNLKTGESYVTLLSMAEDRLQYISDAVQEAVLGDKFGGDRLIFEYIGGFNIEIDKAYAIMNGHDLEESVKTAFPGLRRHHKTGALLRHIISVPMNHHRGIVPLGVLTALTRILSA